MAKPLSCFIVTIHTPQGVDYRIVDEKTFTIGRSLDATLSFSDPNISRVHLIVYFKHDRIWIEDQKSANGTFLNSQKVTTEKMTPIEPLDQIKLGTSNIVLSFNTFEKCFKKDELKSPVLPAEDRESLMSLIQGAHAEAQRLVKLGQEYHDKMLAKADTKAQDIEKNATLRKEETLEAAKVQSAKMISDGEAKAQLHYQVRLSELTAKADEDAKLYEENYKRNMQQETEKKMENILTQVKEEAEKEKENLLRDSKEEIRLEKEKAQQEVELLLSSTKEKVRIDLEIAHKEVETLLAHCKEDIRLEKEKLSFELSSSKEELSVLKNEVEEQKKLLSSRRKHADDEIAFMKKEAEEKIALNAEEAKKDLQIILQKKTQETEFEQKRRWEEVELKIQTETLQFEKNKKELSKDIQAMSEERKQLQIQVQQLNQEMNRGQEQCSQYNDLLSKIKPQYQDMQVQLEKYNSERTTRKAESEKLEKQQAHLLIETQSLTEKLNFLKKDYENQSTAYKIKLKNEYEQLRREQDSQLDQLKLVEISEVKKVRDRMIEDLFKEKDSIAKNILGTLEKEIGSSVNPQFWNANFDKMRAKVLESLEEKTTTMSTESLSMDLKKNNLQKKQSREKFNWISTGVMAGLLSFFVGQKAYEQFQMYEDPMKQAAADDAKARAEDLERRKFNPEQNDELRETYADSVIYTRNFVQNYLEEEFQHQWLKAASNYLLKQWRIEEENTIQILSAVNTLVKNLDEKKQAIHPDFISEGIQKMNELEAESTEKIKEMLGSQVKLEAFRRFEKKFYLNYEGVRAPAATTELPPESDK